MKTQTAMKYCFNKSILKQWLALRNHAAKHPDAYLPETKLRARERARLWIKIIRGAGA